MFHMLGHYVEAACKEDMNTFVTSGFVAHYAERRDYVYMSRHG